MITLNIVDIVLELPAKFKGKFYLRIVKNMPKIFNILSVTSVKMNQNCIFCKIITGEADSTKYYEDEETLVFKDIKPAAKHHFLSIPKKHITNINSLTKDDIPLGITIRYIFINQIKTYLLVNKLVEEGKKVLLEQGGETENMLLGFHCPPFNAISHLHLHVISPRNEMSFLSRIMFKPKSWWFITVSALVYCVY